MVKSVTIFLVFQLAGEVLVQAARLPIPGPVIGMLLLFGVLAVRGAAPASLTGTAHALLDRLALLYVPAGVGIMVQFALIRQEWLPILLTLVLSFVLTLIVTALVLHWLITRTVSAAALRER